MNDKIKDTIGITLFGLFIVGILLGIYLLVVSGLFEILGVQYQSNWSLIIFVISIFLLGFPVDLIMGAISDLSTEKIAGKVTTSLIQFLFGFVTNWIVIFIVNAFMKSIDLSLLAILVLPFIITLFELVFGGEKEKRKKVA